jgi:lipoprotein-anchoring transpeptidase ErfK/SrfK
VRRPATAVCALLAAAGFAAAVALPTQAARTATGTGTGTAPTTTSGTTPVRSPARSGTVRVEAAFPAAGRLAVSGVAVRRKPSVHGRVIKVLHQFRSDFRRQEVFAVGKRVRQGRVWYRISIPMRPNGTYGWVPASTVLLRPTAGRIVVHIGSRTIDVYRRAKRVWHAPVAVGAPGMETPRGRFYVAARFVPYHDPFLGVFAVETSAYSRLTEWPGGGVVGIHGTNMPWLLGKAVSHGCVRVSNRTAEALRRYAPLGTPIVIRG